MESKPKQLSQRTLAEMQAGKIAVLMRNSDIPPEQREWKKKWYMNHPAMKLWRAEHGFKDEP